MNNVFVYCELEGNKVADVSLELCTKGRKLANQLGVQLEAVLVTVYTSLMLKVFSHTHLFHTLLQW